MIVEPKGYYDFLRAIQDPMRLTTTEQAGLNNVKSENILERHRRALDEERRANPTGHLPVVCVVGSNDYDELMGALMALYGASLVTDKSANERLNEVMGIVTVKSYWFKHGFFFGSEDREQEEAKKPEPTLAEKIADSMYLAATREESVAKIEKLLQEANAQR